MIFNICLNCGYDKDSNVEAGTPFEDLPEDWTCPLCGAKKEKFVEQK